MSSAVKTGGVCGDNSGLRVQGLIHYAVSATLRAIAGVNSLIVEALESMLKAILQERFKRGELVSKGQNYDSINFKEVCFSGCRVCVGCPIANGNAMKHEGGRRHCWKKQRRDHH